MILIIVINNLIWLGIVGFCFKYWFVIGLVLVYLISNCIVCFIVNIFVLDLVGFWFCRFCCLNVYFFFVDYIYVCIIILNIVIIVKFILCKIILYIVIKVYV